MKLTVTLLDDSKQPITFRGIAPKGAAFRSYDSGAFENAERIVWELSEPKAGEPDKFTVFYASISDDDGTAYHARLSSPLEVWPDFASVNFEVACLNGRLDA